MIPLYRQGDSPIHRLSAGYKLAVLLLAATVLFFLPSLWIQSVFLVLVLGFYRLAGFEGALVIQQLKPLAPILALLLLFGVFFNGWEAGFISVVRLTGLLLLASLITLTTTLTAMIDTITRALTPLQVFGVNTAQLGFMLSLTVRFIPLMMIGFNQLREARYARGGQSGLLSQVVPFLIRSLQLSDALAEAIDARGWESASSQSRRGSRSPP